MAQLPRLSAHWLPTAGRPPETCGLQTRPRTDVDPPRVELSSAGTLVSTPPGTHPPIFWLGDVNGNIPPIRTFGYSRPILVALRSLSLKLISFGYKTPPIRFSQAGGQSAHKARPPQPNLELALTPLGRGISSRRPWSDNLFQQVRVQLRTSVYIRSRAYATVGRPPLCPIQSPHAAAAGLLLSGASERFRKWGGYKFVRTNLVLKVVCLKF